MVRVVASSVRGPAHARDGLPCQDAWLAIPSPSACLAVVCDGMGSRRHARAGAKAATLAVRDAWRAWSRSGAGRGEDMIRMLEAGWRMRLKQVEPDEAATTCMFYGEDGHGRALLAQLGDGLLARQDNQGTIHAHPAHSREFGSTDALGVPHKLSAWSVADALPLGTGEAVVMATDGVSQDLSPDRVGDLASWVIHEVAHQTKPGRALRAELINWPVPNHLDDKTLLVMWRPCSPTSR